MNTWLGLITGLGTLHILAHIISIMLRRREQVPCFIDKEVVQRGQEGRGVEMCVL